MPFLIFALLLSVFYPPIFFGAIFIALACLNWTLELILKLMLVALGLGALAGIVLMGVFLL